MQENSQHPHLKFRNIIASVFWLPVLFSCATYGLYVLSSNFPLKSTNELKFPTSLEELHQLASDLELTQEKHPIAVLILFCSAYLYKQSFAIPGSVFMNLLAGALFGIKAGFPLVCLLTATGASCCYLMSHFFGKNLILKCFPAKVNFLQQKVGENTDNLLYYLLFLRIFPMSPNWLMNMMSPIVNIPLLLFFISVLIGKVHGVCQGACQQQEQGVSGLMPYNFICVQTGVMLSEVRSANDIFSTARIFQLLLIALVALMPVIFRKLMKHKEH